MSRNVIKKASSGGLSSSRAPRFSPAFRGRKHSIILDGETPSENVIVNPGLLKQHKKAPRAPGDEQELMSDQGFAWWSDPFSEYPGLFVHFIPSYSYSDLART